MVNHFNQNTDDILTVKIKVDDENTWNLIETIIFTLFLIPIKKAKNLYYSK
jgi:hypothetical protein